MSLTEGVVVGLYGISGVGKSHLISEIMKDRIEWRCLEGSQVIRDVLSDQGYEMAYFQSNMPDTEKEAIRNMASNQIKKYPGVTIVAGHCSFPVVHSEHSATLLEFEDVFSESDGDLYDAIFYLDKPASQIARQRQTDKGRTRKELPIGALTQWIEHEKGVLKKKCREHEICLEVVPHGELDGHQKLVNRIVEKVVTSAAERARKKSEEALRRAIHAEIPVADLYLLIDGDRTLCPQDTGTLFFNQVMSAQESSPLKQIFERYVQYSFQAFWEVAMLYDKIIPQSEYIRISHKLGEEEVHVYDQWLRFLREIPKSVQPILVSCSNREIWQSVLARASRDDGDNEQNGLKRMRVIAGNNASMHSYVVDGNAKAMVANELRKLSSGCSIFAFGDSALDVPMMQVADRAYIVVDDSRRNKSMESFIQGSISSKGGRDGWIQQLVNLDSSNTELWWHDGVAVGSLSALSEEITSGSIYRVQDYSSRCPSALVLASQTRRADLKGPDLQKVHEEVGKFLADKLLDAFGRNGGLLGDTEFQHVQGGTFWGVATASDNILILPMMRGGEPMARGVYHRFPSGQFIHYDDDVSIAQEQSNETLRQVLKSASSQKTVSVLIVDSVVNSGASVRRAIHDINHHAKAVNPDLSLAVYVLTAVMQQGAALQLPVEFPRVRFLALRVSNNQYVGRGGTDTGNRLFGTV